MKVNVAYLNIALVQIIEGIFEKPQPGLVQYDKYIEEYKELLARNPNEKDEKYLAGLSDNLSILLTNASQLDLNNLVNDAIGVYMNDEAEARALIEKLYVALFPGIPFIRPELLAPKIELVNDPSAYW